MPEDAQLPLFPVLETERLWLRELTGGDSGALFAVLSDPDVIRFYDIPILRIEQTQRAIERHRYRFIHGEALRWGITLKSENKVIGNCGYSWDKDHHFATLSYVLGKAYWGQGIMTEALRVIILFGFEQYQFHRFEAEVALPNIGSMHVLQKLGFQEEGLRKERFFAEGRYYDEMLFALLKSKFVKKFGQSPSSTSQ